MMKRFLVSAATAALICSFASSVYAQEDQFQTLVDKGLDQYRARQYDEAVANFEAAFKIRQEPELLYNIARSYEKALRREQAIDAYKRFLELKGTTAELRANARTALDALEREKAAEQNPTPVPPLERTDSGQKNAVTGVQTTPPGESHTVEYVMMGGGGLLVVAGLVVTVLAFQANSDFDNTADREEKVRLQSTTKRNAAIADVLVISGVVIGGAGAVLYLISGDDDSGKVAAGPMFNGDTLSFSLSGTF